MFFKKNKNKNILFLSIDGKSIGISFYKNNECIYSDRRINISNNSLKPISIFFNDIFYAFKHQNISIVDEIVVILESPWIEEKSIKIKESRKKSFKIRPDLINSIIKTENKNDVSKNIRINYVIENIKLNGYNYLDPINKNAHELEIFLTKFYADPEIINFIKDLIKNFWNKTPVSFITGSQYIFNIAKNLKVHNDLYVYLGSTDTILRIYSQGVVLKKIRIPYGFEHLLKELNQIWSTETLETNHWLDIFIKNELNEIETQRIKDDIRKAIFVLNNELNTLNTDNYILSIERPIKIYGSNSLWNKVFIFILRNKYFGEVFSNIEETEIKDLSSVEKKDNNKKDDLINFYITNK